MLNAGSALDMEILVVSSLILFSFSILNLYLLYLQS